MEGHEVERDDWARTGSPHENHAYFGQQLAEIGAGGAHAAYLFSPNAKCPVCDADVFFYKNSHGSRVFFDDLGPPWPKHPCTDSPSAQPVGTTSETLSPVLRPAIDLPFVRNWLALAQIDPYAGFQYRHGLAPWDLWRIDLRIRRPHATFLVLSKVTLQGTGRMFLRHKRLPKCLSSGETVHFHKGWISFFDLATMEPVEIEVEKVRSASAFIDQLVSGSGD